MCSVPVPCHHHHLLVLSRLRVSNSQAEQRADIYLEIMVWGISPQASRKCVVSAVYHGCWNWMEELLIPFIQSFGELLATSAYLPCLVCLVGITQASDSFALPLLRFHLLGKNGLGVDGAGTMCGLERRFAVIQILYRIARFL